MLNLSVRARENQITFSSCDFAPDFSPGADFWRMFLDHGGSREVNVLSCAQSPENITQNGDTVTITYNKLTAENGRVFDIRLKIQIKNQGGALLYSADIQNNSEAVIDEMQLPFIDFKNISCDPENEILYTPDGLGAKHQNPRDVIQRRCHTEYMSADHKGVWYNATYPHCTGAQHAFSMPWMGVQSGDYFVYIGKHDPVFRITGFHAGAAPRGRESLLRLAVSEYPAVRPGESLQIDGGLVAVFKGDWRDGAAYYKKWAKNTWYKPRQLQPWIRKMTGWQRVILKHQHGEIYFKYSDLPRLYKEGLEYKLNTLLVFGWWAGCFDNSYPEYSADPELGGAEALRNAIREIEDMGGKVILYTNGNLIDIKTNYYHQTGREISSKDIDGNEYREFYRFSNNGSILRIFGHKSFVTACHSNPQWREKLVENAKLKMSLGASAIFYDQLGCCAKLCFDESHPHGQRIDLEPEYRSENIRAICESAGENTSVGTEWAVDRYANLLDYIHGCGHGMSYSADVFPAIFRHSFPENIISNRFIHDEKDGYQDHLNYAFVYGLIFDVGIYRCKTGIAEVPGYAAHVKLLLEIKERFHRYFYEGEFRAAEDLNLSRGIHAAYYLNGGDELLVLWNSGGDSIQIDLFGGLYKLTGKAIAVFENGKEVIL